MRREAVVGGLALLAATALIGLAPAAPVDNSAEALLAPHDERSALYEQLLEDFGGQTMLLLEFKSAAVAPAAQALLSTQAVLDARSDVVNSASLASVQPELTEALGDPELSELIEAEVVTQDLSGPWNRALRLLECADGSSNVLGGCPVVARSYIMLPAAAPPSRAGLRDALLGIELPAGVALRMVGLPLLDLALHEAGQEVEKTALPLLVLVIVCVLMLLFRKPLIVLATMAVVGLGVLASEAMLGVVGASRNLVVDVAKPVLLVLLLASSIHLIVAYRRHVLAGASRAVAPWAAAQDTRLAISLALLTTAVGFGSLGLAEVPPIRSFGLSVAAGLGLGILLITTSLPLVLSWLRPRVSSGLPQATLLRWVQPRRKPALTIASGMLLCLLGAVAFSQLRIEPHAIRYFPADSDLRRDWEAVEQSNIGLTSLDLVVQSSSSWLDNTEDLAVINDSLEKLAKQGPLRSALGLPLLLREANYRGTGKDALPDAARNQQLFEMLAPRLGPFLSKDQRSMRIALLLPTLDAPELNALRAQAAAHWKDRSFSFHFTGVYDLLLQAQSSLLKTLSQSLGITAALMTLFLMFAFRSARLGLWALLPNLSPVAAVFLLMAMMGWSLDVGTCMVAAVALGIAVDDTMHYGLEWLRHGETAATVRTGSALVSSTIVISAGFLALSFTGFAPTQRFGVLTAVAVAVALVCDLTVWPAILARVAPEKTEAPSD